MNNDIFYSPEIVDFTIMKGAYYERFILDHPGLIAARNIRDTYTICYAKVSDYKEMTNYMGTDYIHTVSNVLGLCGTPGLEAAGIIQVQEQPYLNLSGKDVLIGFVDTGIDYTQNVFKYEDGTSKIKFIYDQTIPGTPPNGFDFGTEYTNEQINQALASDTPYEIVPHKDESGHGTFLASISAGRPDVDFIGAAPDSEIIMVKLNKASPYYMERFCVPKEQKNAFASTSVMLGVEYILQKAEELHRPVVICIGLASSYDSHDGYSHLEDYLFTVCNIPGVCVCIAVGNESQSRHHYAEQLSPNGIPKDINIKVGENAGDIFIIITNRISDRISVSVRSPTGEFIGRIPARAGFSFTTSFVLERSQVNVQYFFPLIGSGDQVTIVRILDATPGIWVITAFGDIIIDGNINAWLPITGFVSPDVEFLMSTPYTTITFPATGVGPIRCGAYNSIRDSLYPPSSWGPTRLGPDVPDLVAPGYQIEGFYPSGYGFMDGSSVGTAITAGACALLLQWGIIDGNGLGFCTPLIRAYLIRGCNRNDVMKYPNPQWGFGTLDLMKTFFYMREL